MLRETRYTQQSKRAREGGREATQNLILQISGTTRVVCECDCATTVLARKQNHVTTIPRVVFAPLPRHDDHERDELCIRDTQIAAQKVPQEVFPAQDSSKLGNRARPVNSARSFDAPCHGRKAHHTAARFWSVTQPPMTTKRRTVGLLTKWKDE